MAPVDALWPASVMSNEEFCQLRDRLHTSLIGLMRQLRIAETAFHELCRAYLPLATWVHRQKGTAPLILGVNGAQGSGKSTLCEFLALVLEEGFGHRVAGLSIDDIYKTRAERQRLATTIHPLLITRGVPGTHDVALGLAVLDSLVGATPDTLTRIPAFDKSRDDRRPEAEWPTVQGPPSVIIFEGWCVGARPQHGAALAAPVNDLEREEDPDGTWRRYVNAQLAGDYCRLFARLDRLIMLKVPGMQSVHAWRGLQEEKLAAATGQTAPHRIMDAPALRRFIMHYERLTKAMLEELPDRADVTLFLDENHHFTHLQLKH